MVCIVSNRLNGTRLVLHYEVIKKHDYLFYLIRNIIILKLFQYFLSDAKILKIFLL
jgi:hypothetical protein